jgi:hypothetical protein
VTIQMHRVLRRYIHAMYRRDTSKKIRRGQRNVQMKRRPGVAQVSSRCRSSIGGGPASPPHHPT